MLKFFQRLGGALFAPVLLFPFAGLTVALTIILKNPDFVGSLADPNGTFYKLVYIIEEGGWTVFRQLPLIFAVGLPIGLAKKAHPRACLSVLVTYLTYNYFINAILTFWGSSFGVDFTQNIGGLSGLTTIAGIKTLDTSIVGAIAISGLTIYIHNKFFDTKLPDFLGIFQGSALVGMIAFLAMIPASYVTCLVWPKVQMGISSLQLLMTSSGTFGVWLYTLLERILIPTGLHHFVYGPFIFGPAVIDGGIQVAWAQNLSTFANSTLPLKELFPAGGFALHGNSKMFGAIGIALAMYKTARPEKKKVVAGLLIPAALTAVLVGITEPLEFTFLFIAPFLFAIHSVLAATMAAVMYAFGVVGNMGSGLIEIAAINWIPLFKNHSSIMFTQLAIGIAFIPVYYFVFSFFIEKFKLKTPGREDEEEEVKLYTKQDFKNKKDSKNGNIVVENAYFDQAYSFLEALGGASNIEVVNNCATRLRVTVLNESLVENDATFRAAGAHGVVRKGKSFQIIVGLSVPQVRDCFEDLMNKELENTKKFS
ncbi:alpha-glucoside-specific PTS transporter subunit IIBC [uncultured Cetobacterium sp.]|uniref:alpha-glucoside-specific PTS transporter subunit IIBC n=1 Tax=uncultured Cetobacterium sp. TaxID=527638 RepID=UPI0025E0D05C|nr:alpha-glucoside-specific PTS transporter subunit IIBC [uncultured Cetobacterium sp.]